MLRKRTIFIFQLPLLFSFIYFYITPKFLLPGEDAAILFNYVENFISTGVISYYPDGPATEGNSDFLFFLFTSLLYKVGWDSYSAALIVTAVALFFSSYGLLAIAYTRKFILNFLIIASVYFSLQIWAGLLGYGTILFGMFYIWMLWAFFSNNARVMYLNALLLCIDRADGILYSFPLLVIYFLQHSRDWKRILRISVLWFVLPYSIYFIWRWHYFGMFLPLPFYIKSRGERLLNMVNISSFYINLHYVRYFLLWAIIPLLCMIIYPINKLRSSYLLLMIIGVVIPFWGYSAMVMEMNLAFRYQYPMYLSLVVLIIILAKEKYPIWAVLFLGVFMIKTFQKSRDMGIHALQSKYNNMYKLSDALALSEDNTMAVTEAGILAWRSKWETYDMWGLNSSAFTKRLISIEDVKNLKPTLINIHTAGDAYDYLWTKGGAYKEKSWEAMCYNAFQAGVNMQYQVWMLPYDYRNYIPKMPPLKALPRIYYNLVNRNGISTRYDMFMLDDESKNYSTLRKILENHGGITWEEYKKRGGQ